MKMIKNVSITHSLYSHRLQESLFRIGSCFDEVVQEMCIHRWVSILLEACFGCSSSKERFWLFSSIKLSPDQSSSRCRQNLWSSHQSTLVDVLSVVCACWLSPRNVVFWRHYFEPTYIGSLRTLHSWRPSQGVLFLALVSEGYWFKTAFCHVHLWCSICRNFLLSIHRNRLILFFIFFLRVCPTVLPCVSLILESSSFSPPLLAFPPNMTPKRRNKKGRSTEDDEGDHLTFSLFKEELSRLKNEMRTNIMKDIKLLLSEELRGNSG